MKKILTLFTIMIVSLSLCVAQGNSQKVQDSFSDGDVVTSSTGRIGDGVLKRSSKAYADNVVGVFSEKTEIRNTPSIIEHGIAYVRFDNSNGEVIKGDYVTSSTKAGYSMKAKKPGMVLGVVLEDSATSSNNLVKVRIQILWINKI